MLVVNKHNAFQAIRWLKNGDHPDDAIEVIVPEDGIPFDSEGQIVRRFNHPFVKGTDRCPECDTILHSHGWIDFGLVGLENTTVCPGDWIIYRGDEGYRVLNDNDFKDLYVTISIDGYDPGLALDKLLADGKTKIRLY